MVRKRERIVWRKVVLPEKRKVDNWDYQKYKEGETKSWDINLDSAGRRRNGYLGRVVQVKKIMVMVKYFLQENFRLLDLLMNKKFTI